MQEPVPLSFPALLRNPGLTSRYAHLSLSTTEEERARKFTKPLKSSRRDDNVGKRWVQRKNNAHFTGNPHIVAATKRDLQLSVPRIVSTFPEPLPVYLPRNSPVPPIVQPEINPDSANAGRFTLSLKGMRRELRSSGTRAQMLVRDIELEIQNWLHHGGVILAPDNASTLNFPGIPIGAAQTVKELSRTPLQLVWLVNEDSFARYVIHCCARFHEIVSFSKEVSGQRLTYLLRPNTRLPNHHAATTLQTPPATDIDYSSQFESDDLLSDSVSEAGSESGLGNLPRPPSRALSEISEGSDHLAESWSLVGGDTDADGDESESDVGLAASVDSLTLDDPDATLRAEPRLSQLSIARSRWMGRSASSPSRSPARRSRRRRVNNTTRARNPTSFYDYLFL